MCEALSPAPPASGSCSSSRPWCAAHFSWRFHRAHVLRGLQRAEWGRAQLELGVPITNVRAHTGAGAGHTACWREADGVGREHAMPTLLCFFTFWSSFSDVIRH